MDPSSRPDGTAPQTQFGPRGKDTLELHNAKGKLINQDFVRVPKDGGQGWFAYPRIKVGETDPAWNTMWRPFPSQRTHWCQKAQGDKIGVQFRSLFD